MTILLLCIFLLLALSRLLLAGKRRAGRDLLAIGIAWALVVGCGPLPKLLLGGLLLPPPELGPDWQAKNAIVLLGAGLVRPNQRAQLSTTLLGYPRLVEAARLYTNCKRTGNSCTLIASGGDPQKNGTSEAEIFQRDLVALGIPEADILLESKSLNTFENARFTSGILRANAYDRIVLVTSGLHLRRALKYFAHFDVAALGFAAEEPQASLYPFPLAGNFLLSDLAIHEYVGLARFRFYNLMGWNSK